MNKAKGVKLSECEIAPNNYHAYIDCVNCKNVVKQPAVSLHLINYCTKCSEEVFKIISESKLTVSALRKKLR